MKRVFNIFSDWGINGQDGLGRTRLYRATKDGDISAVKSLIKSGAKINIKNNRGLIALHQASYWGELEIVKNLLYAGADFNADNGKGWTPLHSAALSAGLPRRMKVIEMLIDAGANPDKQDIYGWSPKDYMKLWENHDRGNLKKLHNVMDNKEFIDDIQQPDITKLGLEKHKPEPPAHHMADKKDAERKLEQEQKEIKENKSKPKPTSGNPKP